MSKLEEIVALGFCQDVANKLSDSYGDDTLVMLVDLIHYISYEIIGSRNYKTKIFSHVETVMVPDGDVAVTKPLFSISFTMPMHSKYALMFDTVTVDREGSIVMFTDYYMDSRDNGRADDDQWRLMHNMVSKHLRSVFPMVFRSAND